jgi:hypothetical protein
MTYPNKGEVRAPGAVPVAALDQIRIGSHFDVGV